MTDEYPKFLKILTIHIPTVNNMNVVCNVSVEGQEEQKNNEETQEEQRSNKEEEEEEIGYEEA